MINDSHFRVEVISRTPDPQRSIYAAMHQDYSHKFVYDDLDVFHGWKDPYRVGEYLDEKEAGLRVIRNCLKFKHFGPLEHPQIILNIGGFPHSTMQQYRTHRTGVSFDCQSFRYTSKMILNAVDDPITIQRVFYIRPVGYYTNGKGKKCEYTHEMRKADLGFCYLAAVRYKELYEAGLPEEHCRSIIPFDIRQNWVMSMNLRAAFHIIEMRSTADVQPESQVLAGMILEKIRDWCPEVTEYFIEKRIGKNLSAP